ncbi:MAG TPA: hypothetical protein VGD69_30470 [Herpetosiphonaceae bacterium]
MNAILIPAPHPAATADDMTALALEIMEAEGRPLHEALIIAGADLDLITAYGERWDSAAFFAGNDEAMPF